MPDIKLDQTPDNSSMTTFHTASDDALDREESWIDITEQSLSPENSSTKSLSTHSWSKIDWMIDKNVPDWMVNLLSTILDTWCRVFNIEPKINEEDHKEIISKFNEQIFKGTTLLSQENVSSSYEDFNTSVNFLEMKVKEHEKNKGQTPVTDLFWENQLNIDEDRFKKFIEAWKSISEKHDEIKSLLKKNSSETTALDKLRLDTALKLYDREVRALDLYSIREILTYAYNQWRQTEHPAGLAHIMRQG